MTKHPGYRSLVTSTHDWPAGKAHGPYAWYEYGTPDAEGMATVRTGFAATRAEAQATVKQARGEGQKVS